MDPENVKIVGFNLSLILFTYAMCHDINKRSDSTKTVGTVSFLLAAGSLLYSLKGKH